MIWGETLAAANLHVQKYSIPLFLFITPKILSCYMCGVSVGHVIHLLYNINLGYQIITAKILKEFYIAGKNTPLHF